MISKHTAVLNLTEGSFSITDSGEVTYGDGCKTIPTEAEVQTEMDRLQAEEDAQEYARNRKEEYPSIGDQLDMMYKDTKNSTTTHADAVEAVKTKWPKDNSGPK